MPSFPDEVVEQLMNYVLADLRREEISSLASRLLDFGVFNDAIIDAAFMEDRSAPDVRRVLDTGLQDAGIQLPSKGMAAIVKARLIAQQILAGAVTPYEGARRIWWECSYVEGAERLTIFTGLASEYEDRTQDSVRKAYASMIREEAEALVNEVELDFGS